MRALNVPAVTRRSTLPSVVLARVVGWSGNEWEKISEVPSNFERYWIDVSEKESNIKNTISCI